MIARVVVFVVAAGVAFVPGVHLVAAVIIALVALGVLQRN
jgi:hypothetical protein